METIKIGAGVNPRVWHYETLTDGKQTVMTGLDFDQVLKVGDVVCPFTGGFFEILKLVRMPSTAKFEGVYKDVDPSKLLWRALVKQISPAK